MLFSFATRPGSPQPYILITVHIILFFYLAYPQEQGHHNSVSQLLSARYYLSHPVNFPCGRKPKYPEKTQDFQQSIDYTLFK